MATCTPKMSSFRHEGHLFFIYDHKKKTEEDDPKDAILYFYPPSVDVEIQIALVGGLIGLTDFCVEFLPQCMPSLVKLSGHNFALVQHEDFIIGLSGSPDIPGQFLVSHMQYVWSTFIFYQGSLTALKQRVSPENFLRELDQVWDMYLPLCQLQGDVLSQSFQVLPYVNLSKSYGSLYLHASHILQRSLTHNGVIAGAIFNKNRVLCSQVSNSLTRRLLLLMSHNRFPCVEANSVLELPGGVRLLYVFLPQDEAKKLNHRRTRSYHKSRSNTNDSGNSEESITQRKSTTTRDCVFHLSSESLGFKPVDSVLPEGDHSNMNQRVLSRSTSGLGSATASPTTPMVTPGTDSEIFLDTVSDLQSGQKLSDIAGVECQVSSKKSTPFSHTLQRRFDDSTSSEASGSNQVLISAEVHHHYFSSSSRPDSLDLQSPIERFTADSDNQTGLSDPQGNSKEEKKEQKSLDRYGEELDSLAANQGRDLAHKVGSSVNKEGTTVNDVGTSINKAGTRVSYEGTSEEHVRNIDKISIVQTTVDSNEATVKATIVEDAQRTEISDQGSDMSKVLESQEISLEHRDSIHVIADGQAAEAQGLPSDIENNTLSLQFQFTSQEKEDSLNKSQKNECTSDSVGVSVSCDESGNLLKAKEKEESDKKNKIHSSRNNIETLSSFNATHEEQHEESTQPFVSAYVESVISSSVILKNSEDNVKQYPCSNLSHNETSVRTSQKGNSSGPELPSSSVSPTVSFTNLSCTGPVKSIKEGEKVLTDITNSENINKEQMDEKNVGDSVPSIMVHGERVKNMEVPVRDENLITDDRSSSLYVQKALATSQVDIDESFDPQVWFTNSDSSNLENPIEDDEGSLLSLAGADVAPCKDRLTFEYMDSENSDGGILSPMGTPGGYISILPHAATSSFYSALSGSDVEARGNFLGHCVSLGDEMADQDSKQDQREKKGRDSVKWTAKEQGLEEMTLYVQGHSDTLLVLLLSRSVEWGKNHINSLWKSCLSHLAELDFEVKDAERHTKDDSENLGASYQFMHYKPFTQSLTGSALLPVTRLANEIVDASVLMHEMFTNLPDLQDITFRSHSAACVGRRSVSSETYFQMALPHQHGGICPPNDKTFILDQEAERLLINDVNIPFL